VPIDTKEIIKNTDSSICLRMVELVTFILENCRFGDDGKAVGKTPWDEKLLSQLTVER
jgi:hypothetical protein